MAYSDASRKQLAINYFFLLHDELHLTGQLNYDEVLSFLNDCDDCDVLKSVLNEKWVAHAVTELRQFITHQTNLKSGLG